MVKLKSKGRAKRAAGPAGREEGWQGVLRAQDVLK